MENIKKKEVLVINPTKGQLADKKLRVAAYCRVSTDSEDQVNSFIAQVKYYSDFIKQDSNKVLVDIYADEAVIIGLKPPSTNGRRFSPIFLFTGHFPI